MATDQSGSASELGRALPPAWPMVVVCVGALLPWTEPGRSGVVGEGGYAFALAATGLMLFALTLADLFDLRWWRACSVPLALGCLALSAVALKGHGALGALVTAAAALSWLVSLRRGA